MTNQILQEETPQSDWRFILQIVENEHQFGRAYTPVSSATMRSKILTTAMEVDEHYGKCMRKRCLANNDAYPGSVGA